MLLVLGLFLNNILSMLRYYLQIFTVLLKLSVVSILNIGFLTVYVEIIYCTASIPQEGRSEWIVLITFFQQTFSCKVFFCFPNVFYNLSRSGDDLFPPQAPEPISDGSKHTLSKSKQMNLGTNVLFWAVFQLYRTMCMYVISICCSWVVTVMSSIDELGSYSPQPPNPYRAPRR